MNALGYRPALDGIRGIAIALVVSVHAFGYPHGGYLGVDLFFVLSGFLITTLLLEEHAERGRISLRAFYERRARRLLPGLFAMLAVYALVDSAVGGRPWLAVVGGIFYFTNVAVAFFGQASSISHLWSLALEEQFYLVWPVALIVLLRRGSRLLGPLLLGCLIAAWLEGMWLTADGAPLERVKFGPDTRSIGLVAGCLFAVWRCGGKKQALRRASTLILFVGAPLAGYAAVVVDSTSVRREQLLPIVAFWFGALIYRAAEPGTLARLLGWSPLVWLGGISYALYLWHDPMLAATGVDTRLAATAAVAAAVAAAALSTRYVEAPFRRSGSRGRARHRSVASTPAAPSLSTARAATVAAATLRAGR